MSRFMGEIDIFCSGMRLKFSLRLISKIVNGNFKIFRLIERTVHEKRDVDGALNSTPNSGIIVMNEAAILVREFVIKFKSIVNFNNVILYIFYKSKYYQLYYFQ